MTHYKFSKPIRQGLYHGKAFYAVEVSEYVGSLCVAKTTISLESARKILMPVFTQSYKEVKA